MTQRPPVPAALNQLQGKGLVKSVDELEADLKQMVGLSQGQREMNNPKEKIPVIESQRIKTDQGNRDEDLSAFNKFVSLFNLMSVNIVTCYIVRILEINVHINA